MVPRKGSHLLAGKHQASVDLSFFKDETLDPFPTHANQSLEELKTVPLLF
jgi:hypothetical protein